MIRRMGRCVMFVCLCASLLAIGQTGDAESGPAFIGRASCAAATCHGGVIDTSAGWHSSSTVWEARDPHVRAGLLLQEPPAHHIIVTLVPAAETDAALFRRTIRQRCVACHAPETVPEAAPESTADSVATSSTDELAGQLLRGVGCESCHGAAGKWLDRHTRSDFRASTVQAQMLGMRDTKSLATRVENCTRCHIGSRTADNQVRDVNHDLIAAGHPRMLFDPLVMQSKLPSHWDMQPGSAMNPTAEQRDEIHQAARRIVLEVFSRLKAERKHSPDALPRPEFSEFDCNACHHPLARGGGT